MWAFAWLGGRLCREQSLSTDCSLSWSGWFRTKGWRGLKGVPQPGKGTGKDSGEDIGWKLRWAEAQASVPSSWLLGQARSRGPWGTQAPQGRRDTRAVIQWDWPGAEILFSQTRGPISAVGSLLLQGSHPSDCGGWEKWLLPCLPNPFPQLFWSRKPFLNFRGCLSLSWPAHGPLKVSSFPCLGRSS